MLKTPCCVPIMPNLVVINLTDVRCPNVQMSELPLIVVNGPTKLLDLQHAGNGIAKCTGPFVDDATRHKFLVIVKPQSNDIRCFAEDVLSMSISLGLKIGRINLTQNDLSEQIENDPERQNLS